MDFSRWEPIYEDILSDFGFDRSDDENSVRLLKAVTMNSDLHMGDDAAEILKGTVTVVGNAPCLEEDISNKGVEGTVICSGSSVGRTMSCGIVPDIVFKQDMGAAFSAQIDDLLQTPHVKQDLD